MRKKEGSSVFYQENPINGIIVPTILRVGKFRFFFFSNERSEPRHVHVESAENYAKFWLEPVDLASSVGYNAKELNEIRHIVIRNAKVIKETWDACFGV